jgi:DNA-binding beta-propeller fold protein YncE
MSGSPFAAGTHPSALVSDSTGGYVYVTDSANAEVLGYSVSSGILSPLTSGTKGGNTFPSGNRPLAITADPSVGYLYVANEEDSTVTAYSIGAGGALTTLDSYATGLEPVAIGIDPSKNNFLYTANFLGNNVSGFEFSLTGGTLVNSQQSPYTANAQPTAVAAVPHGGIKK